MPSLLWIVLPYLALTSFLLGHIWRYRHDRFRSLTAAPERDRSQRLGLIAFRCGFLTVLTTRVIDLVAAGPASHSTGAVSMALTALEALGGAATAIGAVVVFLPDLIHARPAVTPLDRITVPTLIAAMMSGVIVRFDPNSTGTRYRTAETLFTWIRSLATAHPNTEVMRHAPVIYQARGLIVLLIVAIWPYTRLSGSFAGPAIRIWLRLADRPRARAVAAP